MFKDTPPRGLVERTTRDPLAGILLQNSTLTDVQFETLLIASLRDRFEGQTLSKREMAALRGERKNVSRGSFNRTLSQAQDNVIRSIYTVLLLGYTGLFDSPQLEPFVEVANQLRSFAETKAAQNTHIQSDELEAANRLIAQTLETTLKAIATRESFRGEL